MDSGDQHHHHYHHQAIFMGSLFKWDPNRLAAAANPAVLPQPPSATTSSQLPQPLLAFSPTLLPLPPPPPPRRTVGMEEHFQAYGIRYFTAAKIAELGFTVNTLIDMRDEELDDMMNSLSQIFRWELLVGERYGIKAAVRAERRRLLHPASDGAAIVVDALSQEGLSEEPVQQDTRAVEGATDAGGAKGNMGKKLARQRRKSTRRKPARKPRGGQDNNEEVEEDGDDEENEDEDEEENGRQREHPFIVTEPGEVARGKKNGLDYLFHLYDQCREFLIQVQNIAKERGEKCPTKVTNQVFRYAKKAGASYINKPKMRHYVHCYALHCLDEEASNALRRAFKERGENVGAWRQACYGPLVAIAARDGSWDIDSIFNSHPRLSVWYIPTRLRQLCHAQRSRLCTVSAASSSVSGGETTSAAARHHRQHHQHLPPY
ncbi:hypothetical protein SAY86_026256 [Trapa natans]|uniref:Floricaula/leafy-like transcription factor n=1 Tax=Trapa natans TaxID=22666 RepID=A0AAN7QEC9_TRANT|nr:hypothetical protein SAY86_026256 [Trapa natans]